jgi:hypothetical protein
MTTDTIITHPKHTIKKPVETFDSFNDYDTNIFSIYLEFIIYLVKIDIQCYRTVFLATTDRMERDLLLSMIVRKRQMKHTFREYRIAGQNTWFKSAFKSDAHSPGTSFVDHNPLQGLCYTFHFAYQKEYESMSSFEKVSRSNLETDILILLQNAVEHQRRHILYLDNRLSRIPRFSEQASTDFETECAGGNREIGKRYSFFHELYT